jgi:hypothetical protein
MEERPREKIEVLRKIDIPGGDPRWPASVQVERRTANKDGVDKTYINILVALGERKLFIPRRIAKDIGEALVDVHADASRAYEELLVANNTGPHNGGSPNRNSRGYHGHRGRRGQLEGE